MAKGSRKPPGRHANIRSRDIRPVDARKMTDDCVRRVGEQLGSADDRRFEVLRAIVADFVSTKEPIGSKSLVERHNLGVSSATVRNDMAGFSGGGVIAPPPTPPGRGAAPKG